MKLEVKSAGTGEYEMLPELEMINVRLANIEHFNTGEYDRLRWTFDVTDPAYDGRRVTGTTSTKFVRHKECKAYNWAHALTGDDYADAAYFDTDDLLGANGRIILENVERGDRVFQNVKDVYPAQQAVRATNEPEAAPF